MTGTVSCVRWLNYVINKQELVAPILHRYGETGIAPEQGFEAFSITRTDLEGGFTQLGIDDFTCQYLNAFMVALPADGGPVDGLPNQQPVPAINWWRALNRLLELCHPIFMREMFARKEFHPAWKPSNLRFWPSNPIQDPEQLKEYTESVIALAVAAEYPLSAAQREIENITLAAFQIVPGAIGWPSIGEPSNMVEAIQSLHGLASRILIDEPENTAIPATTAPKPVDHESAAAKAMADDNYPAVAEVAAATNLSIDEKMRRISVISTPSTVWKSPQWAKLLGVTAGRIRQTDTWLKWREADKKD